MFIFKLTSLDEDNNAVNNENDDDNGNMGDDDDRQNNKKGKAKKKRMKKSSQIALNLDAITSKMKDEFKDVILSTFEARLDFLLNLSLKKTRIKIGRFVFR